jgi:hypothetical protein
MTIISPTPAETKAVADFARMDMLRRDALERKMYPAALAYGWTTLRLAGEVFDAAMSRFLDLPK